MLIRYMLQSLITGLCVGVIVCAYRAGLSMAEAFAFTGAEQLQTNILLVLPAIVILLLIGYMINYLVHKAPQISGGGVLYVQESFHRTSSINIERILYSKFIAGILAICGGLFLGKVGPALQLGACTSQLLNKLFNTDSNQHNNMLASATSAAMAAAMDAPLAGIVYTFENLSKRRSWMMLLMSIPGTLAAYLLAVEIFGGKAIIQMQAFNSFQIYEYFQLIFLGIFLGFFAFIFGRLLLTLNLLYDKHVKVSLRVYIPLACSLIFAIYFPIVLGLGNRTLEVIKFNHSLEFLIVLFILKTLFFILAFAAGVPGGMFFPILIIGSLFGAVSAEFAVVYMAIDRIFFVNIVLVSMAGFFAAAMRAPVTAIILVSELTLSASNIIPMMVVCPVAYYMEKVFRGMYEQLQTNNSV